jgi:hypothetical protein
MLSLSPNTYKPHVGQEAKLPIERNFLHRSRIS